MANIVSLSKTLIILGAVLIAAAPAAFCADAPLGRDVRVCVLDGKDAVNLSLEGRYAIRDIITGRVLMEGPHLKANIRASQGGMMIGDAEFRLSGINVTAEKDAEIYADWKRFRGELDVVKRPDGKFTVINHIGIEEYLYGVLFHEVSHRWPMEALKAQAIAARTFALYQARQNRDRPYDMRSDIYSQVYGGKGSETWATTRAVNLTKGMVLSYKGQLFPAYFHATCAGFTEDASNLWKVDIAPLKGGVFCPYCRISPHYLWHKEIPLGELEKKLGAAGHDIGRIVSVRCLGRNASGRVDKMEIKDDAGKALILPAKDFRLIMGPNDVRSARFITKIKWGKLVLDGLGWGHGAGMCQWGAYGLGKKGKTAGEILQFYYPGSEIVSIAALK